ncbi:hypothetical protein FO519_007015, partial [Halicephalobus sp. NKZ332]
TTMNNDITTTNSPTEGSVMPSTIPTGGSTGETATPSATPGGSSTGETSIPSATPGGSSTGETTTPSATPGGSSTGGTSPENTMSTGKTNTDAGTTTIEGNSPPTQSPISSTEGISSTGGFTGSTTSVTIGESTVGSTSNGLASTTGELSSSSVSVFTTQSGTSPNGPPPPTTIPNCPYTSQDFILSFFLDETTYPDQAGIVIQFLTAVSTISNPAGSERDAYVYNIATGSQYISKKLSFDNLVSEYISQGVNSTGVTTLSLEHALTYYQQSGPTPQIATTIAPTIIMVTSKSITDLDQTKSTIDNLRQNRTAYIMSVTLSSDATNQLSDVELDLRIDLTNATKNSAQDAVSSIINMICSVNNNH